MTNFLANKISPLAAIIVAASMLTVPARCANISAKEDRTKRLKLYQENVQLETELVKLEKTELNKLDQIDNGKKQLIKGNARLIEKEKQLIRLMQAKLKQLQAPSA